VISQNDLRGLLKVEEQRVLLGVDADDEKTVEAFARIARAADAPFALSSSLGRLGGAYVLSLTLLDAKEAKVLRRVTQTLVGRTEELTGSVRTAALALALEERGVTPDLSQELIEGLRISEKSKHLLLSFSAGYESSIGSTEDAASVAAFMPAFLHLRLEAEIPLWSWGRLVGGLGFATTAAANQRKQDKYHSRVYDTGDGTLVGERTWVGASQVDYTALRVPLDVGVKLVPETGRLLPFFLVGIGLAWQNYSFGDAAVGLLYDQPSGVCDPPFATAEGHCQLNFPVQPAGDVSTFALDFTAAAGLEWLLTHHLGIRVEARYVLAWAFKGEGDLLAQFSAAEPFEYDPGTGEVQERFGDAFAVRRLHQGLAFTTGLIVYW
jgi:opacity protein-like surface antigen